MSETQSIRVIASHRQRNNLFLEPENVDTFELLQQVGSGEEKITAAQTFTPNIRSPFKLTEKQPIA